MKTPLLTISFLLTCSAASLFAGQPNFLLLLSDDQGWNGLSCQMHPDLPDSKHAVIQTPHIATLASEGMRFSAAYSPSPVCSPTRVSLQTGKSPAQCHWTKAAPVMTAADGFKLIPPSSRKNIEEDEVTIGQLLQSAGYATAHYGKWHLGGGGPEQHGYHESDGNTSNQHAAPFVPPNPVDIFGMGERAAAFMEKARDAGRPFYIQMSYHALHYPENATPELMEKYQQLMPRGRGKGVGQAALSEDLDRGVGKLLAQLEALGLRDNTYVIYMSDNGSNSGDALRGGKGDAWEGGIRVPLIIRGPGIEPNSWCHQRVAGFDLFPTLCQLAGVRQPLPAGIEGGSIVHLLKGEDRPVTRPREELVFHFPHYQGDTPHTALYLGDYKLLRFYEDHTLYLFDLSKDIKETQNLAESLPALAQDLEARMDDYLNSIGATLPTPNPQYDPENPPTLTRGPQGSPGGGNGRGSGKGRKGPGGKDRNN